jgi:hypothetical protein
MKVKIAALESRLGVLTKKNESEEAGGREGDVDLFRPCWAYRIK